MDSHRVEILRIVYKKIFISWIFIPSFGIIIEDISKISISFSFFFLFIIITH